MEEKKKCILMVEDDKMLAEMYIQKFKARSFDVVLALTPQQALDFLKKEKPSLILIDILLEKEDGKMVDGFELLQKCREFEHLNDVPKIIISNYETRKALQQAFEFGVKDYLVKSNFTPTELVDKVMEHFEKK